MLLLFLEERKSFLKNQKQNFSELTLQSIRKFTKQENLVQWVGPRGNVEERYYYVFRQGELEELVDDEAICFNEKGNWGIIIEV